MGTVKQMGIVKRSQELLNKLRAQVDRVLAALRARLAKTLGPLIAIIARCWAPVARFFSLPLVQRILHWSSAALLLATFAAYGAEWLGFNRGMLLDPNLQSDDARTSVFPFHRYAADPALEQDPIADEMLSLVPSGIRLLYRILVPFSDVFIAPKIVQGMAFALVLGAGVVLWRSRRTGLAAGVLLVFFVYHDWFAVERIAGGLGRAFGFPCFALWLAGVLANSRRARFSAPLIAALTYPSVMLLILAAEGFYSARDLAALRRRLILGRLRRYLLLLGACFLAVLPSTLGGEERGPVYTLEQAQQEPAFGKAGRLWVLPFAEPSKVFLEAYLNPLMPQGESPLPELKGSYGKNAEVWAASFFACLVIAALLGLSPNPLPAIAFTASAVILYLLSRVLAFQLYSPERYYSFGMRMAALALMVSIPARMFGGLRRRPRAILNNLVAAALLLLVWGATGNGQKRPSGMFIDRRQDSELYAFVRTLPKNARFASHPLDGDGIPYFGARATMGTFETLQPWFVESWRRQKERCFATLDALYASDTGEVLRYAESYHVTHFLINKQRYKSNFAAKSGSFQPFTTYAKRAIADKKRGDLVFSNVPASAVVYSSDRWQVVDVSRLAHAGR